MENVMEKFAEHVQEALRFHSLQVGSLTLKGKEVPLILHTDTLFWSWMVMAFLIVLGFVVRSRLTLIPGAVSLQSFFEMVLEGFGNIAEGLIGHDGRKYIPFVVTIFLFVLFSNWLGLIPTFIPPTRDVNTTVALALISFIAFNWFGIRKKGVLNWILHFIQPVPRLWHEMEGKMKYFMIPLLFCLFLVLNIIEELARIISLSMRLFGNIMGEHIVMAVLIGLTYYVLVIFDVMPLFVWGIGLLAGFIQALIFALLTLSYIAGAVGEHH